MDAESLRYRGRRARAEEAAWRGRLREYAARVAAHLQTFGWDLASALRDAEDHLGLLSACMDRGTPADECAFRVRARRAERFSETGEGLTARGDA